MTSRVSPKFELMSNGLFLFSTEAQYRFPWQPGCSVTIEAGYVTNFASIPWFGRWLVSPIDPHIIWASLVHDWLTNEFGWKGRAPFVLETDNVNGQAVPNIRKKDWRQSATIMRKIMKAEGAPAWKRMVVYWSVRLYGIWKRK